MQTLSFVALNFSPSHCLQGRPWGVPGPNWALAPLLRQNLPSGLLSFHFLLNFNGLYYDSNVQINQKYHKLSIRGEDASGQLRLWAPVLSGCSATLVILMLIVLIVLVLISEHLNGINKIYFLISTMGNDWWFILIQICKFIFNQFLLFWLNCFKYSCCFSSFS